MSDYRGVGLERFHCIAMLWSTLNGCACAYVCGKVSRVHT